MTAAQVPTCHELRGAVALREEHMRRNALWFNVQMSLLYMEDNIVTAVPEQLPAGSRPEISEENRRKFDQWWATQLVHNLRQAGRSSFRRIPISIRFDPELELPKLQRWFVENQHLAASRFSSTTQEQHKNELRSENVATPNMQSHLSINGYSNHSPTNGGGFLLAENYLNSERLMDHSLKNNTGTLIRLTSFLTLDLDIDDEEMTEGQPSSPTGPLSLTTRKRFQGRLRTASRSRKMRLTAIIPKRSYQQQQNILSDMQEEDDADNDPKNHF
ncbi:hypothetical protein NQ318_010063 [Aromia moschata]|uniref:Uncharacterized protein n=1 Tax=Aromia moschata TaxID=1265417 RepID=A0AAV8YDM4_9CUCU|nr:hypothetical protein NQ318_010063 [Aromia moschata]